jgi:predicted amidohydrolase
MKIPWFAALSVFFALACWQGTAQTIAAGSADLGLKAPESKSAPRALRVAAVQFSISESDLQSLASYRAHVESLVVRCLAFQPDLIVFPEYTSVFLALIPYHRVIEQVESAEEGIAAIRRQDNLIEDFRDLFLLNSGLVERSMDLIFAELARRHGVAILAGSYFAWEEKNGTTRLVNRAVVFDSRGAPAYTQDKVYLTPFEEQLLGISAGTVEEAGPFDLNGFKVGVTICRDTFFSEWQQSLAESELWIDIKANGTDFNEQERERFLRALPARIVEGEVPYGLTVCLTGTLLDLCWEGPSSLVTEYPTGEILFLRRASSPSEEQLLFAAIPQKQD